MAPDPKQRRILAVISFADGWRILPDIPGSDCFTSREAAVSKALDRLKLEAAAGHEAELLVHERFGELRRMSRRATAPTARSEPRAPEARVGVPRKAAFLSDEARARRTASELKQGGMLGNGPRLPPCLSRSPDAVTVRTPATEGLASSPCS